MFHTSRSGVDKRSTSSAGQASPPTMSSRTWSSASAGHRPASVGTVDTAVMLREISQGPRSMPERTRLRGAGTRQEPCAHAIHISSQDASNATDRPASTRSSGPSGPSGWFARNSRDSASTNAAALRCVTATPLGLPVDPEVKMIHASSSGSGSRTLSDAPGTSVRGITCRPSAPNQAAMPASPKTISARSSGSSASTGT